MTTFRTCFRLLALAAVPVLSAHGDDTLPTYGACVEVAGTLFVESDGQLITAGAAGILLKSTANCKLVATVRKVAAGKTHMSKLFAKLGAATRAEATAIALRKHLLKI